MHEVLLMVRRGCGSCVRVAAAIAPVCAAHGASFDTVDVDIDPELAREYGDRVPVTVLDGEEFDCWECDPAELAEALANPVQGCGS